MHAVHMGQFEYEGYTLAYEEHGAEGGTPVLLMHGILLDAAVNRDLAGPLVAAGHRVILLDLLGHGRSDRAEPTELRNDFYAEQVVACLDHLKIDQAVVGGLSLGAIVALHVACASPQRVKALWLEMPVMEQSTVFAALLLAPIIALVDYAPWAMRAIARVARRLPRPRTGIWESGVNACSQEPESIKAVLHGVLVGSVVPSRRARRRIQVPSLVIGHNRDWLHNLDDAEALAEELPNSKLIHAHSIFELRTKPERLLPDILAFLDDVHGRTTAAPAPPPAADAPDLKARFETAAERIRSTPESTGAAKPSNEQKLRMYALYRQAKDGDVQGARPGMMDVVGRYKYDAWAALKGISREEAMRRYVAEAEAGEAALRKSS